MLCCCVMLSLYLYQYPDPCPCFQDWGWPFSACNAEVLLSCSFGYPSSIVLIADETGTNYFLTSKLHPVKIRATIVTVANGHTLDKLLQVRLLFVWVWELSICELWWVAYWDDAFDSIVASRLNSSGWSGKCCSHTAHQIFNWP